MLISVITPVYNGEKYIEGCIQAVVDQDCGTAEHIVVDGGSKDRTMEIVRDYASRYSHIRWVSERDEGQSDAMNKGIGLARGEILGILNVDDFYQPGVLARVMELFRGLPEPTLLVGNCNVWDEQNTLKYVNKPARLKITDLLLGWEANPHPVNPSAYFYHKSLHDRVGSYDAKEHYAMDLAFLLKAVQSANVVYVDEIWGNYRLLEGAKTVVDKQAGTDRARVEALFARHVAGLSLGARLELERKRALLTLRKRARIIKKRILGKGARGRELPGVSK